MKKYKVVGFYGQNDDDENINAQIEKNQKEDWEPISIACSRAYTKILFKKDQP